MDTLAYIARGPNNRGGGGGGGYAGTPALTLCPNIFAGPNYSPRPKRAGEIRHCVLSTVVYVGYVETN